MDKARRTILYKITTAALGLMLLGGFWLSVIMAAEPVNLVVQPATPREGEPVIATFKLNNPTTEVLSINYKFYANGELVTQGVTQLDPVAQKAYQYAYKNPLKLGEQLNFLVKTQSELGNYEKTVSLPQYSPQVWSSFVSFASFSTSVMSSMSTMVYYQSVFGRGTSSIGLMISVVLIFLLIFTEMTQPVLISHNITVLGKLRSRFFSMNWILLIILLGIIYTTVALIIST